MRLEGLALSCLEPEGDGEVRGVWEPEGVPARSPQSEEVLKERLEGATEGCSFPSVGLIFL